MIDGTVAVMTSHPGGYSNSDLCGAMMAAVYVFVPLHMKRGARELFFKDQSMSIEYIPSDTSSESSRMRAPIYTGGPTPGIITQNMLSEIKDFRELEKIINQFRHESMDLIHAGGHVEAGPLFASLQLSTVRRLTLENLKLALGREEAMRIYNLIPKETQRSLYITEV